MSPSSRRRESTPDLEADSHAPVRQTWQQVRDSVDLDEGDIVKILHRTQDLLRQVGGLDLVPEELRRTARQAADSFQRSPLTDLL